MFYLKSEQFVSTVSDVFQKNHIIYTYVNSRLMSKASRQDSNLEFLLQEQVCFLTLQEVTLLRHRRS